MATPAVPMPELEPVAHAECRLCFAAERGRTGARARQAAGRVRDFNRIIATHPHRRMDDGVVRP
ncbi:hypothetical protein [Streptomyces bacillaris]|uniref:hypothetical protein n=1 Tax=Streptomyces bacillaris TaxID=68179 RepID=UPI00346166E2